MGRMATPITQAVGEVVTSLFWSLGTEDTVQGQRRSQVAPGQIVVKVHGHQAYPGWSLLTEFTGQGQNWAGVGTQKGCV